MYINFTSAVLNTDGKTTEVIVPGVVQSWNDLAGYKKFEEFMSTVTDESIIDVGITYLFVSQEITVLCLSSAKSSLIPRSSSHGRRRCSAALTCKE